MKGLKKVALASAVAAISAGAQAELKALDDSTMGELTGQAGLTIDVETKWSIGEFAYKDAGFVLLQGISMGGNSNETGPFASSYLDNFRMTIDVAGDGTGGDNLLAYGFSEVKGLSAVHANAGNSDTGFLAMAAGFGNQTGSATYVQTDAVTGAASALNVDDERTYGDGDLVIHFGFTDAWQKGGGFAAYANGLGSDGAGGTNASLADLDFDAAVTIATTAVDYQFDIDVIGVASSGYDAAIGTQGVETYAATDIDGQARTLGTDHSTGLDATSSTTALISGLSFRGYLGPADLHIENNGNGFGADGSGLGGAPGTGNADSKITWGSFFKVTDLDVYIDIAGVDLRNIKIHNVRGDLSSIDGAASFGFAHSIREIYAVKDTVLHLETLTAQTGTNAPGYVDGIALNTEFKGDIDIGALSFGDTGTSIGEIYLTDVSSDTNWTISAH